MALRAQIDINTVIVGDLNTPQSPIDMPSRHTYYQRKFRGTPHMRPNTHG
jgi:hypothetical protein